MLTDRTTLAQFLIEERRRYPHASGDLNGLILNVALACKAIANRVAMGELSATLGVSDVAANECFLRATQWGGQVAGMVSAEMAEPYHVPAQYPKGKYLLAFNPLEGASNIDVNASTGSIFSILRAPHPGTDPEPTDYLKPGAEQVCAGYAIYGPSTMLVLSVGTGVHAFTLDRAVGEFVLTRQDIRIPSTTTEFAVNTCNQRFWEPAVQRYVSECQAGSAGPRGKDFHMRWVASLVAETHRILTRGGVFLDPRDSRDPANPGTLRQLYEANPVAFLVEQAGGAASTGRQRVLDVTPKHVHECIPIIVGASDEVERIQTYHQEHNDPATAFPLYRTRGLFLATAG